MMWKPIYIRKKIDENINTHGKSNLGYIKSKL